MKNFYFYFLALIFLISCSPAVRYIGQKSEPTSKLDVFVAEQSIERPYRVIGSGHLGFGYLKNVERLQDKIIAKGKTIGANAVWITVYSVPTGGTSINSTQQTDSLPRSILTTVNTSIQPTFSSGYNIVYLKYK